MKVVYVAGPFTAPNAWEREQNIRRAEAVAHELMASHFDVAVICVHTMARFSYGFIDEEVAMQADLELIRRSDCLVLVEGWQRSKGTQREIREAWRYRKPVYRSAKDFFADVSVDLVLDLEAEFNKPKDESDFCRALWKKVLDETKKDGS